MLVAALTGVVAYRLLARAYDRRIGFTAGLAVVLATPVGFWAQFPKRHAFTTFCAVGIMYFLYRSREGDGVDTRFRAAAYVPVGIAAWVSAAEGAILLLALLAVDVPTGGRSLRSLATAASACVLASLPMFVTNLFVTGNPLEPPRALSYAGGSGSLADRGDPDGGSDTGGGSGGEVGEAASEVADTAVGVVDLLLGLYQQGIEMALSGTGELYHAFIRGGYLPGIAQRDAGEAIRLSFLEAMPLAAALVVVPVVAVRTDLLGRVRAAVDRRSLTAPGTVDAFAVVYGLALALVYLPRLPIHAAVTVRYLLPLYPIAIYGIARQPAVRRIVRERARSMAFTYVGSLLVGGQLLVVYLWATDATRGEAVQTHAILGLLAAGLLAAWTLADAFGYREDRVGAVALALAAAATTAFVALGALWHFAFVGPQALPFV
jgi:4-amino-4-deoxy-L-arabinose transferase-like glycosyltransferase